MSMGSLSKDQVLGSAHGPGGRLEGAGGAGGGVNYLIGTGIPTKFWDPDCLVQDPNSWTSPKIGKGRSKYPPAQNQYMQEKILGELIFARIYAGSVLALARIQENVFEGSLSAY